ncbi:MAG: amidohydrolase [candidate division Zixibacteria bacterium]|nr:amidohydrolase [candidate division Zixibacteria bacterium]
MEVIDAHIHFLSYNYFRLLTQLRHDYDDIDSFIAAQAEKYQFEAPPTDPVRLADRWVVELDRHGVNRATAIASIPGDESSVAEALRVYPDCFIGVMPVNPYLAVAEELVEHAVREWGFRGIALYPSLHRFAAHAARVYPIYRLARRYRLVVYVHFGRLRMTPRRWWGLSDVYDWHYADPADLHQAATDFPTVDFVIPSFGAGTLAKLLRLALQCPNVHVDTSSSNNWLEDQSEFLDLKQAFERTLEAFGPERVLFGTDSGIFPRGWRTPIYSEQMEIMTALGLSDRIREAIMGGNARRLFGLDRDQPSYVV